MVIGGVMERRPGAVFALLLGMHVAAMAATWPDVILNDDESIYVDAALSYGQGRAYSVRRDFVSRELIEYIPSLYPIGTSLVQVPFAGAFGWRGAYAAPLIGCAVAVWATARLLASRGLPPMFAMLVLCFTPVLVLMRVATSDTVTTAMVALGLAAFASAVERPGWRSFAAGFIAGLTLAFREATALIYLPFYIGSVVRRDPGVVAMVAGGVSGACVRAFTASVLFGDPWYRHPGYGYFSLGTLWANLPFYLIMTTVVFPLGAWAVARYRGWRWPELTAAVVAFSVLHASYQYGSSESGGPLAVVIGGRYIAPLVPLFALAVAQWWVDLVQQGRPSAWRVGARRWTGRVALAGGLLSVAIHPAMYAFSRRHIAVATTLCGSLPPKARVLVDGSELSKWTRWYLCDRGFVPIRPNSLDVARRLLAQGGEPVYVAFGYRTDSDLRVAHQSATEALARQALGGFRWTPVTATLPAWMRLQLWRVEPSNAAGGDATFVAPPATKAGQ